MQEGRGVEHHLSRLKPHHADTYSHHPILPYYFSWKTPVLGITPSDYEPDCIVNHRVDAHDGLMLKVRWKVLVHELDTWEQA